MAEGNKTAYDKRYKSEHIKRVPLDMQKTMYERLKAHAVLAGIPVNQYIKEALEVRMDKEDKKLGVSNETLMRVNENGRVEYYRRYSVQ